MKNRFQFHRFDQLPPYVFAEVTGIMLAARRAGEDIIDLGMGNPDLPNVAVAPGIGFGKSGEGFVRFSLVQNEQRIRQALRNIRRMLGRQSSHAAADASAAETL